MKRTGYYVEGRWYGINFHQARARAAHLSQTYGRGVDVDHVSPDGKRSVTTTVFNTTKRAA